MHVTTDVWDVNGLDTNIIYDMTLRCSLIQIADPTYLMEQRLIVGCNHISRTGNIVIE